MSSRVPMLLSILMMAATGVAGRPAAPGPLEPLRFMAGCWRGPADGGKLIEEHYTTPSENLILGMTRYTRGGVATGYEFSTIAWKDSAIVLTPRPEGRTPVPFGLTVLEKERAVWENLRHDFPTRIVYRRVAPDTLVARIEGPTAGGTASEEWRMGRVGCEE